MKSDWVIVRSASAGVFFGKLNNVEATPDGNSIQVTLKKSRRLWYWAGAATLSELANKGVGKPSECKFPAPIQGNHVVLGVIEVIQVTPEAKKSIDSVAVWSENND